jgi:hypothetical protein
MGAQAGVEVPGAGLQVDRVRRRGRARVERREPRRGVVEEGAPLPDRRGPLVLRAGERLRGALPLADALGQPGERARVGVRRHAEPARDRGAPRLHCRHARVERPPLPLGAVVRIDPRRRLAGGHQPRDERPQVRGGRVRLPARGRLHPRAAVVVLAKPPRVGCRRRRRCAARAQHERTDRHDDGQRGQPPRRGTGGPHAHGERRQHRDAHGDAQREPRVRRRARGRRRRRRRGEPLREQAHRLVESRRVVARPRRVAEPAELRVGRVHGRPHLLGVARHRRDRVQRVEVERCERALVHVGTDRHARPRHRAARGLHATRDVVARLLGAHERLGHSAQRSHRGCRRRAGGEEPRRLGLARRGGQGARRGGGGVRVALPAVVRETHGLVAGERIHVRRELREHGLGGAGAIPLARVVGGAPEERGARDRRLRGVARLHQRGTLLLVAAKRGRRVPRPAELRARAVELLHLGGGRRRPVARTERLDGRREIQPARRLARHLAREVAIVVGQQVVQRQQVAPSQLGCRCGRDRRRQAVAFDGPATRVERHPVLGAAVHHAPVHVGARRGGLGPEQRLDRPRGARLPRRVGSVDHVHPRTRLDLAEPVGKAGRAPQAQARHVQRSAERAHATASRCASSASSRQAARSASARRSAGASGWRGDACSLGTVSGIPAALPSRRSRGTPPRRA